MQSKEILKIELVKLVNGKSITRTKMIDFGIVLESKEKNEINTDGIKEIFEALSAMFDLYDVLDDQEKGK